MADLFNAMKASAGRQDAMQAQSKRGVVTAYDPTKALVKVRILPDGNMTGWIPVGQVWASKGVGIIAPPLDGEHVLVQPTQANSNSWTVIARLFSVDHTPPVPTTTNKPVKQGEVAIITAGAIVHVTTDTLYLTAKTIKSKGAWEHEGDIKVSGALTVQGLIKSATDVIAKAVSLINHIHTRVQSGSSVSGPPQQ